jgi:hypothetical protein
MALFTTALGLYGGVLWSCELQGFIVHEMVPTNTNATHSSAPLALLLLLAVPKLGCSARRTEAAPDRTGSRERRSPERGPCTLVGRVRDYLIACYIWNALDRLFRPHTTMMEYIRGDSKGTGGVTIQKEDGSVRGGPTGLR